MPITPTPANTSIPKSGLTPSSPAAAAPGKLPNGSACAAKVEPRTTTKKPTTPAASATIVALAQVLTMKGANMAGPHSASCRVRAGPDRT